MSWFVGVMVSAAVALASVSPAQAVALDPLAIAPDEGRALDSIRVAAGGKGNNNGNNNRGNNNGNNNRGSNNGNGYLSNGNGNGPGWGRRGIRDRIHRNHFMDRYKHDRNPRWNRDRFDGRLNFNDGPWDQLENLDRVLEARQSSLGLGYWITD